MDLVTRQVERSPDPRDQAQALNLRIRSGKLTENRVELAAQLGEVRSRLIYPQAVQVNWTKWKKRQAIIKKSVTVLDFTLPARVAADWAERVLTPKDKTAAKAIATTRAWANCPCEECAETAAAVWRRGPSPSAGDFISGAAYAARAASYTADGHAGYTYASSAAWNAIRAAVAVAVDAAYEAAEAADAERKWQRLRLAAYLLGEVI